NTTPGEVGTRQDLLKALSGDVSGLRRREARKVALGGGQHSRSFEDEHLRGSECQGTAGVKGFYLFIGERAGAGGGAEGAGQEWRVWSPTQDSIPGPEIMT
uniref:Uncharacterized protein n=1 Tax=Mustela putorius furo TaxID=9669 RepID=M3YH94_MUSPF